MDCVEDNLGVSNKISSFVLPLGATVNMNGTAPYECAAAIFLAQAYGLVEPEFMQVETTDGKGGPRRRVGHRGAVVCGAFGDADDVDLEAHATDVVLGDRNLDYGGVVDDGEGLGAFDAVAGDGDQALALGER